LSTLADSFIEGADRFVSDELFFDFELEKRHGSHNQKMHGNRATGTFASMRTEHTVNTMALGDLPTSTFPVASPPPPKDPELNVNQRIAVGAYTKSSQLNPTLRTSPEQADQWLVGQLDSVLNTNTLGVDASLFRRVGATGEGAPKLKVGSTFTDKGYVSTTVKPATGGDFAMRIKAPASTKGAYIESATYKRGEQEFLLPRNTSFRVTGVLRQTVGTRITTVLDVEIIP
jgi:hypothetical protein